MEKELLYWVFSTIVQAFVALLALVGMAGIYKISKLNDLFDKLLDIVENLPLQDLVFLSEFLDPKEKINAINESISKSIKDGFPQEIINKAKEIKARLTSNLEEKQHFIKSFKRFALITTSVIAVSLILLGTTTMVAKAPHILIGLIIASVIGLSLWSLLEAFRLIKRAIMPESLKKEII